MTSQEILFSIILVIICIVVFVLFACLDALIGSIETSKNPTYCQKSGDIYSVHKYVSYRGGRGYEVYHFKRQGNRWSYVKRKEKTEKEKLIIIVVFAIIYVIYMSFHMGLLLSLAGLVLLILSVWGIDRIRCIIMIQKCKHYLRKKCNISH